MAVGYGTRLLSSTVSHMTTLAAHPTHQLLWDKVNKCELLKSSDASMPKGIHLAFNRRFQLNVSGKTLSNDKWLIFNGFGFRLIIPEN